MTDMTNALPDPVDLDRLRERFDDDEELLTEIFQVFVAEAPGRRQGIEAALASGDFEQLARLAHALKGVAGTMFAEPLRQAAYELEIAARSGDRERTAACIPLVLDRVDGVAAFVGQRH
jgi:HPt (histidine-containing phosphotransfer) domain-containing protein